MLKSMELAKLANLSLQIGLLASTESRYLLKLSTKLSLGDLFTTVEENNLLIILRRLASEDCLKHLEGKIPDNLLIELLTYQRIDGLDISKEIIQNEVITGLLASTVKEAININYTVCSEDSTAFFKVIEKGSSLNLIINKDHIFYSELIKLKEQSGKSYDFVLELLAAWAFHETSFHSEHESMILKEARESWGRELRDRLRK